MNKIYKTIKTASLLALVAVGATSCQDWLTLYPQDKVVEEQFWEDKNDLEGVRYAAYKQMCNTVDRLALWGDLRADSYELNTIDHSAQGSRDTYDQILKGMPDSSMSIFDWSGVYRTINYCNKVLQHGAEILEKDKQFTPAEWQQMEAEMTALRALNYFYLIRAFKDVPYTSKVVNSDAEVQTFGLTMQLDVLDSIILDCERVKGHARNRFVNINDTKGLITNSAIYAMLSDMYLWRAALRQGRYGVNAVDSFTIAGTDSLVHHSVKGDYQKCIEYADLALERLNKQNEDNMNGQFNAEKLETVDYGLNYCNMIKNDFDGVVNGVQPQLEAHKEIFVTKNSVESIFELQSRANEWGNGTVNSLFGFSNGTHLQISLEAIGVIYGGSANDAAKFDSRLWYCMQNQILVGDDKGSSAQSGYYNLKYMQPKVQLTSGSNKEMKVKVENNNYNNWIIYRMTDVMLMKAEALACLNDKSAKDIVNAIHRRSYCNYNKTGDVPDETLGTSNTSGNAKDGTPTEGIKPADGLLRTVMNERQVELLGEGKRWFDLVRWAERYSYIEEGEGEPDEREAYQTADSVFIGDGYKGVELLAKTFLKNTYSSLYITLRNRFKNRYGLYCPIYYMEVKASDGKLPQNPVWNKSKYDR